MNIMSILVKRSREKDKLVYQIISHTKPYTGIIQVQERGVICQKGYPGVFKPDCALETYCGVKILATTLVSRFCLP